MAHTVANRVDATQGAQRGHDEFEAPVFCSLRQRRRQPLHPLLGGLNRQLELDQRDTATIVLEVLIGCSRSCARRRSSTPGGQTSRSTTGSSNCGSTRKSQQLVRLSDWQVDLAER